MSADGFIEVTKHHFLHCKNVIWEIVYTLSRLFRDFSLQNISLKFGNVHFISPFEFDKYILFLSPFMKVLYAFEELLVTNNTNSTDFRKYRKQFLILREDNNCIFYAVIN